MRSGKRINSYEIHFVQQNPELEKYLESKFETDLVHDLVEKHNARLDQVAMSPTTGVFSTPSVSIVTLTKPVEIAEEIRYTGIKFDTSYKTILLNAIPTPTDFDGLQKCKMVSNLRISMYRGGVDPDELAWIGGLGATVSFRVIKIGMIPNKIVALQLTRLENASANGDIYRIKDDADAAGQVYDILDPVHGLLVSNDDVLGTNNQQLIDGVTSEIYDSYTTLSQPQQVHLTSSAPASEDRDIFVLPLYVSPDSKRHDAHKITEWQQTSTFVSSLIIKGTVFEKRVTGLASHRKPILQQRPHPVSIGNLVMSSYPNLKGKDVGLAVRLTQAWMKRHDIENALDRKNDIQQLINDMGSLVVDIKALEREVDVAEDAVNNRGRTLQRT